MNYEEWILEADQYAEDVYGLSLDQLGFNFNDGSVMMEDPCYWVEDAYKNYDPTPCEQGEPPYGWADAVRTVRSR